nr:hypothetical protein [Euzebyales bacterium]
MRRLDALLRGPHLRLPRPLDAASERWARLRPRVRMLTGLTAFALVALMVDARVRAAESRWGGPPRPALVATADLPVGATVDGLRRVGLP